MANKRIRDYVARGDVKKLKGKKFSHVRLAAESHGLVYIPIMDKRMSDDEQSHRVFTVMGSRKLDGLSDGLELYLFDIRCECGEVEKSAVLTYEEEEEV